MAAAARIGRRRRIEGRSERAARAIAVDYGPQGIRANALCPGWIITPMGDEAMDELGAARGIGRQEAYDLTSADVPLRRAGTADEMAYCGSSPRTSPRS